MSLILPPPISWKSYLLRVASTPPTTWPPPHLISPSPLLASSSLSDQSVERKNLLSICRLKKTSFSAWDRGKMYVRLLFTHSAAVPGHSSLQYHLISHAHTQTTTHISKKCSISFLFLETKTLCSHWYLQNILRQLLSYGQQSNKSKESGVMKCGAQWVWLGEEGRWGVYIGLKASRRSR